MPRSILYQSEPWTVSWRSVLVPISATMRKIKSRRSIVNGLLPPARRVHESQAQYSRNLARLPVNDGLRRDEDQWCPPAGPGTSKHCREESIERSERRARALGVPSDPRRERQKHTAHHEARNRPASGSVPHAPPAGLRENPDFFAYFTERAAEATFRSSAGTQSPKK